MIEMMKKYLSIFLILSLLACLLLCGCTPKSEEAEEAESESLEVPDIATDENGEPVTPGGQEPSPTGGSDPAGSGDGNANVDPADATADPAVNGGASDNELPIMTEEPDDTSTPGTTTGTTEPKPTEPPATQPTEPPATQSTEPTQPAETPETSGSNELPIIPINP